MPLIKNRKEYDATVALNYSGAKELLKSPLHYKTYLETAREETKALRMGSLTHALVLECESVPERFTKAPDDIDRRTKAGKEAYEVFMAAAAGRTILSADEWEVCYSVADSMREARAALDLTYIATELHITVDYNGVPLKAAIDGVATDKAGNIWLVDLKTCEDASARGFLGNVRSYKYALQNYIYRLVYEIYSGKRIAGFVFIAAEKTAPFAWAAYNLGPELMSYAVADFEEAFTKYKAATTLGVWTGYPSEMQTLDTAAKTTATTPINFA
jgi:exodeoxyribonuclease VIII